MMVSTFTYRDNSSKDEREYIDHIKNQFLLSFTSLLIDKPAGLPTTRLLILPIDFDFLYYLNKDITY